LNGLVRWLRRIALWLGPALVLLLAVACGFVAWSLGTQTGTRWVLRAVAHQLDGSAQGVQGTIWRGLRVREFSIKVPAAAVRVRDLALQVDWRELLDRRLHARNLSVGLLDVDVLSDAEEQPAESQPFSIPALPVRIALDRFYMGELDLKMNGEPLLLDVRGLQASLALTESNAQLVFQSLTLGHDGIQADVEGQLRLLELADPWPLALRIATHAHTSQPDSPLCLRHFLPDLPTLPAVPMLSEPGQDKGPDTTPLTDLAGLSAACALDIQADVTGSLDDLALTVKGRGQDVDFDVNAQLAPRAGFPLRRGDLSLRLADGSSMAGKVDWQVDDAQGVVRDHVTGSLKADKLNLRLFAGEAIPEASLTAGVDFDARLQDHSQPLAADLKVQVGEDSRWNGQPLSGGIDASVINTNAAPAAAQAGAARQDELWKGLRLADLDMNLKLGSHHVLGKGSLGAPGSHLDLDVDIARLADAWPDVPGGLSLKGRVGGTLAQHSADLQAVYTPQDSRQGKMGSAPAEARLALQGGWGGTQGQPGPEGWRGRLSVLQARHAGIALQLQSPVDVSFIPGAVAPAWQWQVGAASLDLRLPSNTGVVLRHRMSRGGAGRWETQGALDKLAVSRRMVEELRALFASADTAQADRGRVILPDEQKNDTQEITFAADWDLKFAGALSGKASVRRLSGDIMVPADPDFPLGLRTLALNLTATPSGASASRLKADLEVATEKMGRATAAATALLRSPPEGGFVLADSDPKTFELRADINDLGWASLFTGDAMDIGGSVHANVSGRSRPDGQWSTSGTVTGSGIRVVRVDDGVRLLDGELSARLDNDRFILEHLRFPARLRVSPKEWRTQEWVTTNPDAKDGSLTLSGSWDMKESVGQVDIDLYRYPLLQRSDRYAMVTGKLHIDAPFPALAVSGGITADAGWIDLDMLSSVPTVDGDVVVLRPGQEQKASAPMDISLDLNVDLGPRFYITGYGVDSGLVGNMHLMMQQGKLTAQGALRTRGGAIDIYGQHLQLRRGTITFQGDITSPLLNIEALRTGVAVEAGVRVAGTAKRPRIDLVSYPDVSDVQKLSWLLLGRGPDDTGGDAALLFSVGTSFLGDGEPFYRKFGLDEVTMRTGELGSTGSILPVESVVRGLDSGTSDIERQFVVASKRISKGFTLSVEQALSETGTVGRASYQLARGLSAELSAGTVTGIALIYRTFFGND